MSKNYFKKLFKLLLLKPTLCLKKHPFNTFPPKSILNQYSSLGSLPLYWECTFLPRAVLLLDLWQCCGYWKFSWTVMSNDPILKQYGRCSQLWNELGFFLVWWGFGFLVGLFVCGFVVEFFWVFYLSCLWQITALVHCECTCFRICLC